MRNSANYMIAAFPSDKLLRENNLDELKLQDRLSHYKYLNIFRYDNKDVMSFAS